MLHFDDFATLAGMFTLADRIARIRERMARAAVSAGRPEHAVRFVAVTKTVPVERILEAVALGLTLFGENRVQDALAKMDGVPAGVEWHLIGHLQANKVKKILGRFGLIHSVDSLAVAREIGRHAALAGGIQEVLVQVNVSREPSKYGFAVEQVSRAVEDIAALPGIRVKGLMTIPRPVRDPEEARPSYRLLSELREEIRRRGMAGGTFTELSMGMSDDFDVAIQEGATLVRIGRAIFGERTGERTNGEPKKG